MTELIHKTPIPPLVDTIDDFKSVSFSITNSARQLTSSVRIVALSDTHGQHKYIHQKSIPAGDLIVHTGDVCQTGSKNQLVDFADWYGNFKHPYKILIGGNHDYSLEGTNQDICNKETRDRILSNAGITLLHDTKTVLSGVNIYGTPWQLPYKQMAFNLDDAKRAEKYNSIPTDTNVLLTHNPPYGILDTEGLGQPHMGCAILRKRVGELPGLKLCIFGHIHLGRGRTKVGETHYVNASMVGGPGYSQRPFQISQEPFVIDLQI